MGPKMDPCGIPSITNNHSLKNPSLRTLCFLSER